MPRPRTELPPPIPPQPPSQLAETVDIELDALEEIELDEPTAEVERPAAPPPPPSSLRSLSLGGRAPRGGGVPGGGPVPAAGSLPPGGELSPEPPLAPPDVAANRYAELFGSAVPYAATPIDHDAWDDDDEDLRPTVIDNDRDLDDPPEVLRDATIGERGLTGAVQAENLDEERDTMADWLGGEGEELEPEEVEPVDVLIDDIVDIEPVSDGGGVRVGGAPRRRPATDLTHLTAMPVLEERSWQPGRPVTPVYQAPPRHDEDVIPFDFGYGEEDDLGEPPELSEAPVGVGAPDPEMEAMDELLRMEKEDEASTIDEELFPQPEVTEPAPPPPPPRPPAPMPKLLGSPGRVLSAASLFDFAAPVSGRHKALSAPTPEPPPPEPEEEDEASIELTEPGERRFPNSLGLSDIEVIEKLHREHFPELGHLDTELLARLCRLEADILTRAAALGEGVRALVSEVAPRSELWQGAVWWSGVVGDEDVRGALAEANNGGGEPAKAKLAWSAWPYLHELLSARGAAEDEVELGLKLARLERSIAQRRTVVRMGPPELTPELERFPVEPRGLNAMPGFRWLAH